MRKRNNYSSIIIPLFLILLVFVWHEVLSGESAVSSRLYFLDVGQGDAELAVFPGGIKILTDAGPDRKIVQNLQKLLLPDDRYIDLAVISHSQLDHFNGFNYLLDGYKFGAFIFNGRRDATGEWKNLLEKIEARKIPLIALGAGDRIKYNGSEIDILSPVPGFAQSAELNDTGLVELVKASGFRALFTADIGFNIENYLLAGGLDLRADILKVGHHGSKYSSDEAFLKTVNPKVAVIEVGAQNRYGHPTKEVLARLESVAAKIFRTDKNGAVEILADDGKLNVFTEN